MSQTHKDIVEDAANTIVNIFRKGREVLSEENAKRMAEVTKDLLESPMVVTDIETIEESPAYKAFEQHLDNMVLEQLVKVNETLDKT